MKKMLVVLCALGMVGCADWTPREQNTAIGATVGGVAGYAIGGRSGTGAAVGAILGGLIGHSLSPGVRPVPSYGPPPRSLRHYHPECQYYSDGRWYYYDRYDDNYYRCQ